jgi:hypothetical protein
MQSMASNAGCGRKRRAPNSTIHTSRNERLNMKPIKSPRRTIAAALMVFVLAGIPVSLVLYDLGIAVAGGMGGGGMGGSGGGMGGGSGTAGSGGGMGGSGGGMGGGSGTAGSGGGMGGGSGTAGSGGGMGGSGGGMGGGSGTAGSGGGMGGGSGMGSPASGMSGFGMDADDHGRAGMSPNMSDRDPSMGREAGQGQGHMGRGSEMAARGRAGSPQAMGKPGMSTSGMSSNSQSMNPQSMNPAMQDTTRERGAQRSEMTAEDHDIAGARDRESHQ